MPERCQERRAQGHLLQGQMCGHVSDGPPVAQRGRIPLPRCQLAQQVGGAQPLRIDRGPELIRVHVLRLSSSPLSGGYQTLGGDVRVRFNS